MNNLLDDAPSSLNTGRGKKALCPKIVGNNEIGVN
jgi:hypothetical protein